MPQTANPYAKWAPSSGGRTGVFIPDPYRAKDEQRKDTGVALDQERLDQTAANNARERQNSRLDNPQKLRKEYATLPEVVQYRSALEQSQRALTTAANPTGDLALTYAFAKAMDPTTGVRDAEQQTLYEAQPFFQSLVQKVKKTFGADNAGGFTPQARAQIRREIFSQVSSLKPMYDARRADMADNAKINGINPQEVIGRDDTATYAPMFRSYGEKAGDPDGTISRLVGGEPIKGAGIPTPGAEPMKAAPAGSTEAGGKIPPEMQQEYSTYLNQNWGKLDPSGFAAFRINLDRKYGFGSSPEGYRSDAEKINDIARKGGTPQAIGPLTPPDHKMTAFEELRNDAVSNKYGAAAATTMNGIGFGLPSLFAGDQFNAIRKDHPGAALVGDIAGGIGGSMLGGGALKLGANALERGGAEGVAKLLANPLTADVGYGTVFGGNDAAGRGDSWLMGGATGALGGVIGNKVGGAIGKAFPGAVKPLASRELEASVPTSDDLKTIASGLYHNMETNGLTASGADTDVLADSIKATLAKAGRITPKDNLANTESPVNTAYKLVSDYAGQPMTPAQYQTVRTTIADGLDSKSKADKRIAKSLLKTFDDWTEATNPAMKETWDDARAVSSRYLQGDALAQADKLAGVRAGQFSQAGMENALRVDYRALAREGIKKGGSKFTPEVDSAIDTVVNGTPLNNTLRTLGSIAPISPSGFTRGAVAMGVGGGLGGPLGAAGVATLGGASTVARLLSRNLTKRAAQVAENTAYAGPEYAQALNALTARAGETGGDVATGITMGAAPYENDIVARALMARNGAY